MEFNILGAHEIRMEADGSASTEILGITSDGITETVEQAYRTASTDCRGPSTIAESFPTGTKVTLSFSLHKINWTVLSKLIGLFNSGTVVASPYSFTGSLPSVGAKASAISNALVGGVAGKPIMMSIKPLIGGGLERKYLCVVPESITINMGVLHTNVDVSLQCVPLLVSSKWSFWQSESGSGASTGGPAVIVAEGAHVYKYDGVELGCTSGGSTIEITYSWSPVSPDDTGPETPQDLIFTGMQVTVSPSGGLEYYDLDTAAKITWLNSAESGGGVLTGIGQPISSVIGKELILESEKNADGFDWRFPVTYVQDQVVTQMPVGHSMFSATWVSQLNEDSEFFERTAGLP